MAISVFLNGHTSASLYSWYSLYSHSVRVAQKTVTFAQKTMLRQKQKQNIKIHPEVTLCTKIRCVTKKYVVATTKYHLTPKREAHVD